MSIGCLTCTRKTLRLGCDQQRLPRLIRFAFAHCVLITSRCLFRPGKPNRTCDGCEQACSVRDGLVLCTCEPGYKLDPTSRTCQDIDECAVFGACSQRCINTKGSFKCACAAGYVRDSAQGGACRAKGGWRAVTCVIMDTQIEESDVESRLHTLIESLSTKTGDNDGNAGERIKLIAQDKRSTWICEIAWTRGPRATSIASFLSPVHTCKGSANASASNRFTRWNLRSKRKTIGNYQSRSSVVRDDESNKTLAETEKIGAKLRIGKVAKTLEIWRHIFPGSARWRAPYY